MESPKFAVLVSFDGAIRGVIELGSVAGNLIITPHSTCRTCQAQQHTEYERTRVSVDGTAWIYTEVSP